MSYDPYDEEFESLLSDIINAFDTLPKRAKKILLMNLFERISTLKILLKDKGGDLSEEKMYFTLTNKFDKISFSRVEEARRFLGELMKRELP